MQGAANSPPSAAFILYTIFLAKATVLQGFFYSISLEKKEFLSKKFSLFGVFLGIISQIVDKIRGKEYNK